MGFGRHTRWFLVWFACACTQSTLGESATDLGHLDAHVVVDAGDSAIPHNDAVVPLPDAHVMTDAVVPLPDAHVMTDASRDAAPDVFVYDAGCNGTDQDQDGICAADDNCPDVNNPSQLNSDGDDDGDACDPPCGADPIAEQAMFDQGVVSGVKINGATNFAELDPGQMFTLTFGYDLSACIPGVGVVFARQLQVGFDNQGNAFCSVMQGCTLVGLTGVATHAFTAPNTAGVYYVRARLSEGSLPMCRMTTLSPWVNESPSDALIAAVCVR